MSPLRGFDSLGFHILHRYRAYGASQKTEMLLAIFHAKKGVDLPGFYLIEHTAVVRKTDIREGSRPSVPAFPALCLLAGLVVPLASPAQNIFVANYGSVENTAFIGEYAASGATVNASLIPGLNDATDVVVAGDDVFVANFGANTVGEYTLSGQTINASLIPGLDEPVSLAVSGNHLFVLNYSGLYQGGYVGEYTLSGQTVNSSLVSGLSYPQSLAVSGNSLFVADQNSIFNGYGYGGYIGKYTTSGATVSATFISTGSASPGGLAVSGNYLFAANSGSGSIAEYTTSGTTINAALVSGLDDPYGLAASGNDLFVGNAGNGSIGEYTTSGATVNPALISGLDDPNGLAVEAIPEPSIIMLAFTGVLLLGVPRLINEAKPQELIASSSSRQWMP